MGTLLVKKFPNIGNAAILKGGMQLLDLLFFQVRSVRKHTHFNNGVLLVRHVFGTRVIYTHQYLAYHVVCFVPEYPCLQHSRSSIGGKNLLVCWKKKN